MKNDIIDFIKRNKQLGYVNKLELACYYNENDYCPNRIFEFDLEQVDDFYSYLGETIRYDNYEKLEIAIIGQTENGENDTCLNIKTIILRSKL